MAPWPLDCDLHLCQETWKLSTSKERQELSTVRGDEVVLYFKVAEAFLKSKTANLYKLPSERAAAILFAQRKSKMQHVIWDMTRPRSTMLSIDFCDTSVAFDTVFAKSSLDFESFFRTLGACRSGAPKGRAEEVCTTWEGFSRDFFAVMLSQMIGKCRKKRDGDLLLLLEAVLLVEVMPTLRLWPAKKNLVDLRKAWSSLNPTERIAACKIVGPSCWLVRASEMLAGTCMTKACLKSGIFQSGALSSSEYEKLKLRGLEGSGCHEESDFIQLTEEFAASSSSLEHILKHAVKTTGDKETLVSIASVASEASMAVAQTDLPLPLEVTWIHVARVTFTLVLEAFEKSCQLQQEKERQHMQVREMEAARNREKQAARKTSRRNKQGSIPKAQVNSPTEWTTSSNYMPADRALPEILWVRYHYSVVRTFVDVEVPSSFQNNLKLRRCTSSYI